MQLLREGVRKSLPEIAEIRDDELRAKVVEAWALSLSHSEFERIEDLRSSGNPKTQAMKPGTQADHIRGVTRMSLGLADELERVVGSVGVDRDLLLACALCHDVGKPFEFSLRNQARWEANPAKVGYPSIPHTAYGVHIALLVELPEAVAHTAGAHSLAGDRVTRSLETTIIYYADHAFWDIRDRAGRLEPATEAR